MKGNLLAITSAFALAVTSHAEQGGGVGPVISYVRQMGKSQLLAELK